MFTSWSSVLKFGKMEVKYHGKIFSNHEFKPIFEIFNILSCFLKEKYFSQFQIEKYIFETFLQSIC